MVCASLHFCVFAFIVSRVESANALVVYWSDTNHTANLAQIIGSGAASVPSTSVKIQTTAETNVQRDVVEWADALILGSPVHYGNPASGLVRWFETEWEDHWTDASPPVALGAVFATGGGLAQGLEHVLASLQRLLWSFRVQVLTPNPTRSGFTSYGVVAVTGTPPWGDNVTHGAIAVPFATAAREFGAQFAEAAALRSRKSDHESYNKA